MGTIRPLTHRIREANVPVYGRLFHSDDDWDSTHLFPLLAAGAGKMYEKLTTYARNHLPGGKVLGAHSRC